MIIIIIIIIDFLICSGISIIEFLFSKEKEVYNKLIIMIINIGPMLIISLIIILFLVLRKKVFCLIAGIIYLVLGILFWLYKSIFYCYIIFGLKINVYFNENFTKIEIIVLVVNLSVIIFRLVNFFIIKNIYTLLKNIEKYFFEREHTLLIQKLGEDLDVSLYKDDERKNEEGKKDKK